MEQPEVPDHERMGRLPSYVRAIIYCAAMAEIKYEVADEIVKIAGFQQGVNPDSYSMQLRRYAPCFRKHPELLKRCIDHPIPVGELPKDC